MKEIRILFWCDVCAFEDEDARIEAVDKVTFGLVSGETKPDLRVLDLCQHHAELVHKTVENWQTVARPPDIKVQPIAEKVVNGKHVCPKCQSAFTQRQGLVMHVWKAHRGTEMPRQPDVCPTCRQQYEPQGMTMHRTKMHGYDTLTEALKGVM